MCGSTFIVTEASKHQYCSVKCGAREGNIVGTRRLKEIQAIKASVLRDLIFMWSFNNKQLILNTYENSITTDLKQLFELLENILGCKDMRTITKCFDTSSRKVFLRILKSIVSIL